MIEELQGWLEDILNLAEKIASTTRNILFSPERMVANFKKLNENEQKVLLNALQAAIKNYFFCRYKKDGFGCLMFLLIPFYNHPIFPFYKNFEVEMKRLFENININLLEHSDEVVELWQKLKI